MRNCTISIVGAASVAMMLLSGSGVAEVFEVQPYQEAAATIASDGFPVSLYSQVVIGDSVHGRYMRGLVSFDLSFLPPDAVVTSAVLHSHVAAVYGNPSSLGSLMASRIGDTRGSPSMDIQPHWGTFNFHGSLIEVMGEVIRGSDVTADLTPHFQGFFPTPDYSLDPGRAVIRVQQENENNGDDIDDFFYLSRIWLELDVEMPSPITERPVARHLKRCIPVVASLPGAAGTQWVTEVHMTAGNDGSVWLYFSETGQDGTTNFQVRRVDLDMWQTVRYEDILPDLFGLERTKGWIEVFSTDPNFVVTARVANVGGEGSYGQTVPLVDESKMLRLNEIRFGDSYQRLVNLVMFDADNRVNVGLVNLGLDEVTAEIRVIAPDGLFLGDHIVEMAPFEHIQIDRLESVIPDAEGVGLASLSVGLRNEGEGNVYQNGVAFYASRVDTTTGDAVFILP